jgi:hypothetical protein
MAKTDITVERLQELTHYDPETGVFTWRVRRPRLSFHRPVGCFDKSTGYRKMRVDGVNSLLHRFAWLYMHGSWPVGEIDHINRDKSDNRICNLRVLSKAGNAQNRPKPINNSSGQKGVYYRPSRGKWVASITVNKTKRWIGSFDSAELAGVAYAAVAKIVHPFA